MILQQKKVSFSGSSLLLKFCVLLSHLNNTAEVLRLLILVNSVGCRQQRRFMWEKHMEP